MSKLTVVKKIRIKTVNSFRVILPDAFIIHNDIQTGDTLVVFMADTGECVIRKAEINHALIRDNTKKNKR